MHEINISGQEKAELKESIKHPTNDTFTKAQKSAFLAMVTSLFDYFVNNEQFKQWKGNHQSIHQCIFSLTTSVSISLLSYGVLVFLFFSFLYLLS